MIKIKQTGTADCARVQSLGNDHMRRISKKSAQGLCGMYPLPQMGCEVLVGLVKNRYFPSFYDRLFVQNISGQFFITSPSVKVNHWPDTFKVLILGDE